MFKGIESTTVSKKSILFLIKDLWGIDHAVFYSLLYKTWRVLSVPVTIWLVITKFSPEVQGYYYTFNSLLIFQTFLELGFGVVMVQFVSHEWAHLKLNQQNDIVGEPKVISHLASLIKMGIKWYLLLAGTFFAVVGTAGYFFLSQHETNVNFQIPWWLLCAAVSFSIVLLPMRYLLEGSNQIAKNQIILLKASIVSTLAGWLAIYYGAGLYSLVIICATSVIVGFLLLFPTFLPFYKVLKMKHNVYHISWRNDFWPQQWRIGVSWLSGFFMFQAFVPIMFYLHGPVIAGQMGVAIQIYNAVNSFAQSWTYAVAPKMGMLSAKKNFTALRVLIKRTYLRSLMACIVFSIVAFLIISLLHIYNFAQAERLPSLISISIFLMVLIAMQLSNVETQAIRFQKKEPFVKASITSAILVILSNFYLGRTFGILGAAIGFALIMLLITIPWCHRIYKNEINKLLW